MQPTVFLIICIILVLLLKLKLIPFFENRVATTKSVSKYIASHALLSALGILQMVASIFAISTVLLIGLLLYLQNVGGMTAISLGDGIKTIIAWREAIGNLNETLGWLILVLATASLVIYAYRKGKSIGQETAARQYRLPLDEHQSKREKILTFFISRGLLKNLRKGAQLLFILSLLLFIPTTVTIFAPALTQTADSRLIELNDLVLDLVNQKINQLGEPQHTLTAEDEANVQIIANAYYDALSHDYMAANYVQQQPEFRHNIIKAFILEQVEVNDPNHALHRLPFSPDDYPSTPNRWDESSPYNPSSSDETRRVTSDVLNIGNDGLNPSQNTALKSSLVTQLREMAKRIPGILKQIVDSLDQKGFFEPAEARDLVSAVVEQFSDLSLGNTVPNKIGAAAVSSGYVNLVESIMSQDANSRVPSPAFTIRHQLNQFILGLLDHRNFSQAINRALEYSDTGVRQVLQSALDRIPFDSLTQIWRGRHPSISIDNQIPNLNAVQQTLTTYQQASIDLQLLTSDKEQVLDLAVANVLADFADLFPANDFAGSSPRDVAIDDWRQKFSDAQFNEIITLNAAEARDFQTVRTCNCSGGVVIGRKASKSPISTIQDIDWEINSSTITFTLTDNAGRLYRSAPYDITIVYLALAYAADGRPSAITILPLGPLPDRRVLLHPVLVNTHLGNEIIELDNFIWDYSEKNPIVQTQLDQIQAYYALYDFAWYLQLGYIRSPEVRKENLNAEAVIESYSNFRGFDQIVVKEDLDTALVNVIHLDDTNFSPFAVRPESYDTTILNLLSAYPADDTNISNFINWLWAGYRQQLGDPDTEQEIPPPPQLVLSSHVTEHAFPDTIMDYIVTDWSGFDPTSLFDFTLRASIDTLLVDDVPWEFPAIANIVRDMAVTGIKNNPDHINITHDVAQFTMAQRLFRAILNGHVGTDFPIEKMADLILDLQSSSSLVKQNTPTWKFVDTETINNVIVAYGELGDELQAIRHALGAPN